MPKTKAIQNEAGISVPYFLLISTSSKSGCQVLSWPVTGCVSYEGGLVRGQLGMKCLPSAEALITWSMRVVIGPEDQPHIRPATVSAFSWSSLPSPSSA